MAKIMINGLEVGILKVTKEDIKRYEEAGFVVILPKKK